MGQAPSQFIYFTKESIETQPGVAGALILGKLFQPAKDSDLMSLL